MLRIKVGDVFEFKTNKGFVYLHYLLKDKEIGDLIGIIEGYFDKTPKKFTEIVGNKSFYVFFPLSFANNKNIVTKVGHIPDSNFIKPEFMRTEQNEGDKLIGWDIVNTNTWTREFRAKLNSWEKELSPWGIWNDTLLRERLEDNWSLQNWG